MQTVEIEQIPQTTNIVLYKSGNKIISTVVNPRTKAVFFTVTTDDSLSIHDDIDSAIRAYNAIT